MKKITLAALLVSGALFAGMNQNMQRQGSQRGEMGQRMGKKRN